MSNSFDILRRYEFDEAVLLDSLDFLMRGAEVEETVNYNSEGEVTSRRTRVKRSPDTVIKSLIAADIVSGGQIGIAKSGVLGGRHSKMIKNRRVVIPEEDIDSRVISNNRPIPGWDNAEE